MSNSSPDPVNPQKSRTGLSRVLHAGGYSLAGLKAGWHEKAFQQEAVCAFVMIPLAFWLGRSWEQTALLAGSVILVLIVELLNTGIEAAIDRISPEWHALSKKAKDMGSAAVFLALCLCGAVWAAALYHRFIV
ncbi:MULTISPECIES: diacylglycerol kinase [Comamonas]|jgi:diacylglycerol kinase (ATP)|uniref:diacylglycerol kinase n=1 Tax=Comamonas TaxID=283 RepID=UPI0012C083C5|nr:MULTISPECIES: diacylglycerol kinase [Comamonas]MDR3066326.1 diacylglycerol kinase [Comamonas sp.]MEB5964705.1 diacylglycerol kinase [Comamonas testosteroni]MPS93403.1 diacylglycerol kinase [Comamonas sp.]